MEADLRLVLWLCLDYQVLKMGPALFTLTALPTSI